MVKLTARCSYYCMSVNGAQIQSSIYILIDGLSSSQSINICYCFCTNRIYPIKKCESCRSTLVKWQRQPQIVDFLRSGLSSTAKATLFSADFAVVSFPRLRRRDGGHDSIRHRTNVGVRVCSYCFSTFNSMSRSPFVTRSPFELSITPL